MCEEELLSLFQASLRIHKNKSRCQCSTGPVLGSCTLSQHSLGSGTLLPHGKSKEKLYILKPTLLKKQLDTHGPSSPLFYSELHQSQSWPCLVTGILFSPPAQAPLATLFPRSLLTDLLRDPYNSCSRRTWTPAHGTKLSLTQGQGLAAIQGSWFG